MYSYDWDPETGGFILKNTPLTFSKEPRPVYYRELDLLGFREKLGWNYAPDDSAPYLWAEASNYFYRGRKVAMTKGGTLYSAPDLVAVEDPEPNGAPMQLVDIPGMVEKNRDIMDALVQETIKKVYNTYMEYRSKVDVFYVAFSGGKDSIVTLDIVQRALPHDAFMVLFGDTQMEFPDTYDVVEKVKRQCSRRDIEFLTSKSDLTPGETWNRVGPPAQKMRWCCSVLKTAPQIIMLREQQNNPHFRGMALMGVRADESLVRSKYDELSLGTKHRGQYDYYPILHWNSAELFLYIYQEDLTMNETYKLGNNRAGCLVCPMSSAKGSWVRDQLYGNAPDFEHSTRFFNDMIINNTIARDMGSAEQREFMEVEAWKSRHNGKKLANPEEVYFEDKSGNTTTITLTRMTTDWKEWIKTLGVVSFVDEGLCKVCFSGQWYLVHYKNESEKHVFTINTENGKNDILFIAALKNVLRKTAYCITCRVCQANCPNGYITMSGGKVHVDDRCVHCLLCHDIQSGCVVATSHIIPKGERKMAGVDRYKTLGVQMKWVEDYLRNGDDYLVNNTLGSMMLSPLKTYLADAGVCIKGKMTPFGKTVASLGSESETGWALMMCNAAYSPEFNWWIMNVEFGRAYTPDDLYAMLSDVAQTDKQKRNVINAFKNIFHSNPILGHDIGLGDTDCYTKGNGVYMNSVSRIPWAAPDGRVILYSLYKFAEACEGYYSFSLDRLLDETIESAGISPTKIFGLDRETMERVLTGLSINYPDFIHANFAVDLDVINLRENKTAADVLTLFE